MQLWPFCKPVWVLSGQFSPPNMCQQNSNDWLSELWKRHKNRLFAPEWLCVANIASREAENEQIVWQDSVRQSLSLKRPTPALPVGREWRTRADWGRPTPKKSPPLPTGEGRGGLPQTLRNPRKNKKSTIFSRIRRSNFLFATLTSNFKTTNNNPPKGWVNSKFI